MSWEDEPVFELHQCTGQGGYDSGADWDRGGRRGQETKIRLKSTIGARAMRYVLCGSAAILLMATSALAITPAEQRGKNFVRANCSRCHAIDKVSPSPLKIAPPFRDLHRKYPIETLQESLAEGIYTGHPTMPQFRLEPDQINDVLSYLKSLE
jgi:mono/diheme cytochrome c family protein